MAKNYSKRFYSGKRWQDTREAYAKSVGYLCERCKERGIITAGEIVHHIDHISPDNIDDASVTLSHDNLQLLCRECHAEMHADEEVHSVKSRYKVMRDGSISPL